MAMWKMKDETKNGFDNLAEKYNFGKEQFADIALAIVRRYLEIHPKFNIGVSPNGDNNPKVTISEPVKTP